MRTFGPAVSSSEANMTKRITPELSDSIFADIEFPDNKEMRRQTSIAKRELTGWHEKNKQRYADPEYKERWSNSIKDSYKDPALREHQRNKILGKKLSDETRERIRQVRLTAPPRSAETKKKLSDSQLGNQKRCKPVVTPFGVFSSLKFAAEQLNTQRNFRNGKKVITEMMKKEPTQY